MKKAQKTTKRYLPHILSAGSVYFLTSSLDGSLPKFVLEKLKKEYHEKVNHLKRAKPNNYKLKINALEREYFKKFDEYLDKALYGPTYLADPEIANILKEQFHRFDGKYYHLVAYTIMSNHFHLLIDTSIQLEDLDVNLEYVPDDYVDLSKIVGRIKGASSRFANIALDRKGAFWLKEYFDRIVRNEKEEQYYVNYILQNPVKAGLVQKWDEYPYSFYSEV
jgi:REP element-mobilizing transposase RayT